MNKKKPTSLGHFIASVLLLLSTTSVSADPMAPAANDAAYAASQTKDQEAPDTGPRMFTLVNKLYVGIGLGFDQVEISDSVAVDGVTESSFESFNFDINVAYYPIERLRLEVGGFKGSSFDLFSMNDQVRLSGTYFSFGPSVILGDYVEVAPHFGWIDWKLELEEGQFLNPGPENKETFRGNEQFLGVHVGWDLFYFRYRHFDEDVGDVSSVTLGFELRTR